MPLEDVQKVLEELSTVGQFLIALMGIVVTLKPILDHLEILLPRSTVDFLSTLFQTLGLFDITYYLRRKEYYEKRSKELEVLQALSSLPYLHQHLRDLNMSASGTSLPVTRSLYVTLRRLIKPINRQFYFHFFYRRTFFNPTEIVTALSSNRRIISREQQDAEEFFQLVSSALDTEGQQVAQVSLLGGGLKSLLEEQKRKEYANPFTGLLANRLSCLTCGYTGAIRHFAFNNIQLNLPYKISATLDECLSHFTTIEYLDDVSCRLCSFKATLQSLQKEIQQAKKKKNKLHAKKKLMEKALKTNQIEDEGIECLRTSGKSSKQVMVAKPPKILCLHVSRSAYLNTGMVYKNPCHLLFPEVLDLAPYTTGKDLNTTDPRLPISTGRGSRVLYELMSVVVHYGSHSSGHFVAYKRCIGSEKCACQSCQETEEYAPRESWYRVSDTKVDKCHVDEVLSSNPYMLFYETVEETEEKLEDNLSTKDEEEDKENMLDREDIKEKGGREKADLYNPLDEASQEALSIANALMAQDLK
ncbi:hypothetical protein G6F56_006370 [Rhizopus delemar]|nr:hypothetical protein G6F56_006370 [Rhizopus delemar]